jgi:hypothetical protein
VSKAVSKNDVHEGQGNVLAEAFKTGSITANEQIPQHAMRYTLESSKPLTPRSFPDF